MAAQRSILGLSTTAYMLLLFFLFLDVSLTRANQLVNDIAVPDPSDIRYQDARDAAQAGNTEWAMQEYAKLMFEEPDNVDYLFGYAQALYWSGEVTRSIWFLEQARKMAPEYEDIWELEYRAIRTQAGNLSRASVDEFREMAAERFPNAKWHRRPEKSVPNTYLWDFGASREYLDNGAPDWEQVNALFGLNLKEKALLTLSVGTMTRFGTKDTQFGFSGLLDMGANWTVTAGLAVSSSPNFLPDTAIDVALSRRFEHGWVVGARWRRRDYESSSVDSIGLVTERYFGRYRIAYSLDSARVSAEQAVVHALTANFYANSGFQLGVTLAFGEEIEMVDPGQLLRTDVNSFAVTGRHPINEYLDLGWRLATHRQGQYYRRNAIGISISGGF